MSAQKQIHKQPQTTKAPVEEATSAKVLTSEALDEDVDELLTAIDGVLEENAEAFVANYVQKGGQ